MVMYFHERITQQENTHFAVVLVLIALERKRMSPLLAEQRGGGDSHFLGVFSVINWESTFPTGRGAQLHRGAVLYPEPSY